MISPALCFRLQRTCAGTVLVIHPEYLEFYRIFCSWPCLLKIQSSFIWFPKSMEQNRGLIYPERIKSFRVNHSSSLIEVLFILCLANCVCIYNIMCLEMLMTDGQSRKTQVEIIKGWDKKQFAITIGTAWTECPVAILARSIPQRAPPLGTV